MMTLKQLLAEFPNEEACRRYLFLRRWSDGIVKCPRCGNDKVQNLSKAWHWQCPKCPKFPYRFSLTTKTIFENTKYPLRAWFQVAYLMLTAKKGISALQVQRVMGSAVKPGKGSYETFWFMCHRLRAAMENDEFKKLLGVVEVDETYIGGKNRNRHWNKKTPGTGGAGKVAVIGAISRKGSVVAKMIDEANAETLKGFVKDVVSKKVELVATDDAAAYQTLPADGFAHASVNHSQKEYVRGIVHTGSIDSFWALLKRGIMGSFHHVSKDYLPLYINEFSFRYNNRHDVRDAFDALMASA